ncbi:hypothetical protein [Streptomyces sp. NPDC056361]|uniref:hypothetical protein n=1 Tax=Streptomyces sp. NPDC056361 TaxID=3345795 RepID=UPI0035DD9B28
MSHRRMRGTVVAALTLTTLSLVTLTSSPASATSRKGCPYPNVCFYLTKADYTDNHPTAMFKDFTTGFQTLGAQSRGAKAVVNTRNDDRASIKFLDGGNEYTTCLPPNQDWPVQSGITVTKLRIESQSACPTGP